MFRTLLLGLNNFIFILPPNLSLVRICTTTKMAGRVQRRINNKFYFVLDEVGASSGAESEAMADDEAMSGTKDDGVSSEKSINENNRNVSAVSGSENKHNVTGCEPNNAEGNAAVSSAESGNTGGAPMIIVNDELHETSGCTNTELTNMDIDNDSDGEIEQESERDEVGPIIKISFRDERIEKMYKSTLLKYLNQKIHSCTVVPSSNSLEIEIYEENTGKEQDEDVLEFHLDTTPNCDSFSSRVPSYGKNHDVVLSDANPSTNTKTNEVSSVTICFNCCGSHVLRDCPHPKNMKTINKNRNKFQSTNKVQRASRYHLDENQKFGDLVPGVLTKKLRNALDLQKDQQPHFIYRMRLLGYPPAWLEEARVSHSGVAIYGSNGIPISEEDEEEGEIIADGTKDRFDINKIIEFPGFNVPLQNNMKEEGKHYSCPELSEEQSKENMIKTLEPNAVQAYKKRSLAQKFNEQEGDPQKREKRLSSPTIEEMEEKKRQLLMELNDEDVTEPTTKMTEPGDNTEKENSPVDEGCKCESPVSKNTVTLDYGTPILKSISPYSKLPSREQFSANVSDVINFENLPNSTGKYESMSSLIHKIRDTVTRIQNE